VLDDAANVGAWQLELRKFNDDPHEVDELVLHVQKLNGVDDEKLRRELNNRFVERTEVHPNLIVFHEAEELRRLLGVGTLLKEQKIIDNRPKPKQDAPAGPPDEGLRRPASGITPIAPAAGQPDLEATK
jgi:hypothetical protein